jgi:hypothetical protein
LGAALVAVLGVSQASAASSGKRTGRSTSFYVLKNAKAACRAHYVKRTVTVRVRRHKHVVRVHQLRCVHAGSGSSLGAAPSFPTDLPTAAVIVNVIPGASADSYSIPASQTLNVAGAGVLANDDGSGLSAVLVSGTSDGALTLNRNGTFSYTPASGFSGVDRFYYKDTTSSGESSTPAAVTIHVTPVAVDVGAYDVASAGTVTVGAPGVLAGDVGSGLTASLVSGVSGGSLNLNPDGSFSYTAAPGFSGSDSFTFEAVDAASQASNPVTVTLIVAPSVVGLQPPTVVPHSFSGAVGNTELQVGGTRGGRPEVFQGATSLLAGDSDPNGGGVSTTADNTITTAEGGRVTLASDGTFVYQPPVDAPTFTSDSFTYQVDTTEGTSAQATATIGFNGARVWYVNSAAGSPGNGTTAAPFSSLASVNGIGSSGDVIFVAGGSYAGGMILGAGETLVGQPDGLTAGGENLLGGSGVNPVITNAGGVGVTLADGDTLSGVDVRDTSGTGVSATGSFTITASVTIAGAGDGLHVNGGGGTGSVAAPISSTTGGRSVWIESRTGGIVTLSGTISDTGNGVLLHNNSGGATVNFAGSLVAATNASSAFAAINGGIVNITGPNSTLSSTGAPALDIASGTVIGSSGLTFQSISAGTGTAGSGNPANGVLISGTGSANGSLTVLGGTIQNTTGTAGVSVANSGPLSLSNMNFIGNAGAAVDASAVPFFTVRGATVTGGGSGIAADDGGGSVAQVFDVSQNTFNWLQGSAIALNYAADATGTVDQNNIGTLATADSGSAGGDGIDLSSSGRVFADVSHNTIHEIAHGTGILAQTLPGGTLDLTLAHNTVTMDSASSQNGVTIASGTGTGTGGAGTVCLDPVLNNVTAIGSGMSGMLVQQLDPNGNSLFQIEGYDGLGVATYLEANNTLAGGAGGALATQASGANGFDAASSACTGFGTT